MGLDESIGKINAIKEHFASEKILDETTIKRFLIARSYDVQKTVDMIQNYLEFRRINDIDSIKPPNGIDIPFTMSVRKLYRDSNYDSNAIGLKEEFRKFYPATGGMGAHGYDLQGHPILIELLGKYNVKKMAELCDPEVLKDFCILNNEFLFGQVMAECSRIHKSTIEKVFYLFLKD